MYEEERQNLLRSLGNSHDLFYQSAVFGGPSFHFHTRALADAAQTLPRFAESSYAMLASWGMHRMGSGGAKMVDFQTYEESLRKAWPFVRKLRKVTPNFMEPEQWETLRHAFISIRAMQSSFSLVATSKVLAHALPNLVPPVDRRYTIKFLHRSRMLPKDIHGQWKLLRVFLEFFFYPLLREPRFVAASAAWLREPDRYRWDTSPLKTIDNILVGHVRGALRKSGGRIADLTAVEQD